MEVKLSKQSIDINAGRPNLDIGGYGGASAQDPPVEISII